VKVQRSHQRSAIRDKAEWRRSRYWRRRLSSREGDARTHVGDVCVSTSDVNELGSIGA
jgi:hypothetical protein